MSHPSLRELTGAAHGLGPEPDHVCPECARLRVRLDDELDLLRRADARLVPPAARRAAPRPARGAGRHLLVAAALFAVAVAAVLLRREPSRPRVAPPVAPGPAPVAALPQDPPIPPPDPGPAPVPAPRPAPPPDPVQARFETLCASADTPDPAACVALCEEILAEDPDYRLVRQIRDRAQQALAEPDPHLAALRKLLLETAADWRQVQVMLETRLEAPLEDLAPRDFIDRLARATRLNVVLDPQADRALQAARLAFAPGVTAREMVDALRPHCRVRLERFKLLHLAGPRR